MTEPRFFDSGDVDQLELYFDRVPRGVTDNLPDPRFVKKLWQAETSVLMYYVDEGSSRQLGSFPAYPLLSRRPQLRGFKGTIDNPDVQGMDQLLIEAIREATANQFQLREKDSEVESISQGNQSISYNTTVSKTSLRPLRKFDDRQPYTYL